MHARRNDGLIVSLLTEFESCPIGGTDGRSEGHFLARPERTSLARRAFCSRSHNTANALGFGFAMDGATLSTSSVFGNPGAVQVAQAVHSELE